MIRGRSRLLLGTLWLLYATLNHATTPQDVVRAMQFEAAAAAISERQAAQLLGTNAKALDTQERRAAALLVAMNMIEATDLATPAFDTQLTRWLHALQHPNFMGTTGEYALIDRLGDAWDHTALLEEEALLNVLGDALTEGVLTGYDLRRKSVYGGFPKGQTFIYSHSSALHLQQLATLMAAHNVKARMYVAPKVSAFMYREDWGTAGDNVKTLASGARILNGREVAVMFEFDAPEERNKFHQLVLQYAKKDERDEAGLIANAWWQPFYYTDTPFADFHSISLVILSSEAIEATLTVLPSKENDVVKALSGRGFPVRVDKVWVNPAFFRFLNGGYR